MLYCFYSLHDTAATYISTLSLHDALPICTPARRPCTSGARGSCPPRRVQPPAQRASASASPPRSGRSRRRRGGCPPRSEEHTSELQSRLHLVCRLLLEKKNCLRY